MDKLRDLFKNKDKPFKLQLALIGALGLVLIMLSTVFSPKEEKDADSVIPSSVSQSNEISYSDSYEKELENRLSALLENVEGVGNVKVMLTISYSSEIILAEDISTSESKITETDSAGGSRENETKTVDSKKIIISASGGSQEPLILKEIVPKVEGVVIVAEGGGNILIKEALINSAVTVLGVEPHKVQVLKMK